jgi:hypothetical protein
MGATFGWEPWRMQSPFSIALLIWSRSGRRG